MSLNIKKKVKGDKMTLLFLAVAVLLLIAFILLVLESGVDSQPGSNTITHKNNDNLTDGSGLDTSSAITISKEEMETLNNIWSELLPRYYFAETMMNDPNTLSLDYSKPLQESDSVVYYPCNASQFSGLEEARNTLYSAVSSTYYDNYYAAQMNAEPPYLLEQDGQLYVLSLMPTGTPSLPTNDILAVESYSDSQIVFWTPYSGDQASTIAGVKITLVLENDKWVVDARALCAYAS